MLEWVLQSSHQLSVPQCSQTDLKHCGITASVFILKAWYQLFPRPTWPSVDYQGIMIMKGISVHSSSDTCADQATRLMLIICLQIHITWINISALIKLSVFATKEQPTLTHIKFALHSHMAVRFSKTKYFCASTFINCNIFCFQVASYNSVVDFTYFTLFIFLHGSTIIGSALWKQGSVETTAMAALWKTEWTRRGSTCIRCVILQVCKHGHKTRSDQ